MLCTDWAPWALSWFYHISAGKFMMIESGSTYGTARAELTNASEVTRLGRCILLELLFQSPDE
jgi:hypothetical protein